MPGCIWHYVWMLHTDIVHFLDFTGDMTILLSSLSAAEQQRAQRFVRESDRCAYIISHAELRRLLSEKLTDSASNLEILVDEHGKPYVDNDQNIHFNLSHSGDYALIAISDEGAVGVDIEHHDAKPNHLAIAQRFFTHNEYLYISSQSDQLVAFYEIWTYKEAYVKAIGRGIAYGLDSFSVVSPQLQLLNCVDEWSIKTIIAPQGYSAATALYVK